MKKLFIVIIFLLLSYDDYYEEDYYLPNKDDPYYEYTFIETIKCLQLTLTVRIH